MVYDLAMDSETSKAFAGVNSKLDGINTRLDGMDTRFDGVDNRLDGVDSTLRSQDSRLGNLERDTASLHVELIEEFRRIDRRFENLIEEVTQKISSDMQRYMGILLERHDNDMRAFNEKLWGQQTCLEDHESRLVHLEQKSA